MIRARLFGLAALCLLGVGVPYSAGAASAYSVTDLGTLGGSFSLAADINNAGQVVGSSHPIGGPATADPGHATIWNGTTPTDLGTHPGWKRSEAHGINSAGQVVGAVEQSANFTAHMWVGGTPTDLGTLGGTSSRAYSINNAGQVVGNSYITDDAVSHATIWNGTTPTDLGTLPGGTFSEAWDINDAGQVVGRSTSDGGNTATIWNNGTPTDLGNLGGTAFATAINNTGQIVGFSAPEENDIYRPLLWDRGVMTELDRLDAGYSTPSDINDAGQIVGTSNLSISCCSLPPARATIWIGGVPFDLNLMIALGSDVMFLTEAFAINNRGQIVGHGITGFGQTHAFLATPCESCPVAPSPYPVPIPLPAAFPFLASGIGVMGLLAWCRKRKAVSA